MKRLLELANRYVAASDWKTIAALKFCLFSLGILAALWIPRRNRRTVALWAGLVFLLTYIPLIRKLYRVWTGQEGGG